MPMCFEFINSVFLAIGLKGVCFKGLSSATWTSRERGPSYALRSFCVSWSRTSTKLIRNMSGRVSLLPHVYVHEGWCVCSNVVSLKRTLKS